MSSASDEDTTYRSKKGNRGYRHSKVKEDKQKKSKWQQSLSLLGYTLQPVTMICASILGLVFVLIMFYKAAHFLWTK